jgi:polyhydroxyalkanoate synthesis repressor PhaR
MEYRQMSEVRVIKKYPNRRLYDAVESRYITLQDLRRLVVDRIDFRVVEKNTQRDLTSSVLLQVIANHERGSESILGKDFLLQLIRSYGDSMASRVRNYLDESLSLFVGQEPVGQQQAVSYGHGLYDPGTRPRAGSRK